MTGSVVSVASPGELLAAVPHLLGFVPRNSLVLVGLRPPRGTVRLTARVDLPPAQVQAGAEVARAVLPVLVRGGCTAAVLAVYVDGAAIAAGPGTLPRAELVTALGQALGRRGITLRDAVCVSGGRFRSYLCHDEDCCDPHGVPVPPLDGSVLAPHRVLGGRRVFATREELVDSLSDASPTELAATQHAVEVAVDRLVARLADGASVPALRHEVLTSWQAAISLAEAGQPVDELVVGALVVGLADVVTRDAVIASSFDDDPARPLALLERLTRSAPHPYVAPIAVLLAWHAYAAGDGALAAVAVDRALTDDPEHSLARLVDTALQHGLPPDALREIARVSREQVTARLVGPDGADA